MKKTIFIFALVSLSFISSFSQSIRKNFNEMTASEKAEIQNAFYQVRDLNNDGIISNDINAPDADDLVLDLAKFHMDFFDIDRNNDLNLDIHFNLPTQINIQIFFSWHRYQMFEMEQGLQQINPKISLGYWDSSVDNDLTTLQNTLFHNDLIGTFDANWGLNRNLNNIPGSLPTPAEVTSAQSNPVFANSTLGDGGYSNELERGSPHTGSHRWTGGAMPTPASPSDPAFYFHHSWVDKLWVDWDVANPGASSFIIQSMIRYDGTYSFNGSTLPLINPNSIIDTRTLGVFYAENQLATLDNYSVSNTHQPIENFYYQYTIEAGDNFNVPNGTSCEIESVNEIVLNPGFLAETGATFTAKIDIDNDITTASRNENEIARFSPIEFGSDLPDDVYETNNILGNDSFEDLNMQLYPNPFRSRFTLNLDQKLSEVHVKIFDTNGKLLFSQMYSNTSKIEVDNLDFLSNGVYILRVETENNKIQTFNILKR